MLRYKHNIKGEICQYFLLFVQSGKHDQFLSLRPLFSTFLSFSHGIALLCIIKKMSQSTVLNDKAAVDNPYVITSCTNSTTYWQPVTYGDIHNYTIESKNPDGKSNERVQGIKQLQFFPQQMGSK